MPLITTKREKYSIDSDLDARTFAVTFYPSIQNTEADSVSKSNLVTITTNALELSSLRKVTLQIIVPSKDSDAFQNATVYFRNQIGKHTKLDIQFYTFDLDALLKKYAEFLTSIKMTDNSLMTSSMASHCRAFQRHCA